MNHPLHSETLDKRITRKKLVVKCTGLLLFILSVAVLYSWHYPTAIALSSFLVGMAYNTAVCIFFLGISLFSIPDKNNRVISASLFLVFLLSALNLVEYIFSYPIGVNYWLLRLAGKTPDNPSIMALTTAMCFISISLSLLLARFINNTQHSKAIVLAVLLNLLALTISATAFLGHILGLMPAVLALGIKMAPHTSISIMLFSTAFIFYYQKDFSESFDRKSYLYRMIVGFSSMVILAMAVGSIALIQINQVSSITQEMYLKPLQVSNSVIKLKQHVIHLNRQLKNIAIKKEIYNPSEVLNQLTDSRKNIAQQIALIRQNQLKPDPLLDSLEEETTQWELYVSSILPLIESDFDAYKNTTLNDGQEQILEIEAKIDLISNKAQGQITALYSSVIDAKQDAIALVTLIVFIFLCMGLLISIFITRSLNGQLQKIRNAMLHIANETNTHPIPFLEYANETGDMARALAIFEKTITNKRRLETRLRQVIEATPNGIIVVNAEGIMEIVNQQAEQIFGYKRTDLIGKPVEMLIPKNMRESHPENRDHFFGNPKSRAMGVGRELFGLHKKGHEIPVEIGLAPVETEEGIKVLAAIVDITERKQANLELNKNRERLELTTRVNEIGVWEYDADTGLITWDDTMFSIYERQKELFTSNYAAWEQCVHPEDLEGVQKLLEDSIQNVTPFFAKFRIVLPDGRIKHIHAKAKIERQSSNNHLRMLGTNIDITREETAYAKLHQLETLRSSLVEYSEDGIISKTPYGIITSWNTGATNMFGYSAEEAIGKPVSELLFPENIRDQEEMLVSKVRQGEVIKHFQTVHRCKDGHLIQVSVTLSPIKDATGKLIGISSIKRDISESVKASELLAQRQFELERINNELERSNKELETFAYVASHDLKSPLRGIAQLSSWIEEDLESQSYADVSEHTTKLRNRILRMEKLLDDLLIFYRAGKIEGEEIEINVSTMAKELFDIQNIKPGLRFEIPEPLPTFTTLSTPFEQVLRNLFSNAIKHHDLEQGVIQLTYKELNSQFFEFCVSDDGPGIPEKFQQRVFGMFQTLKTRDEQEGSGVGLALIKKIVGNYGGYIHLKSKGRGSSFYFSWPKIIQRRTIHD